MPKKNEAPASFEKALSELEQIVTRLESGDLPLEEALNEFNAACSWHVRGRPNYNKPNSAYKFCCLTMKTPL